MKAIRLRKWYLDAVGDDGRVWIGYWAALRLGPVSLTVASTLTCEAGGTPQTRTSVAGSEEPRERDGVVTWSHAGLGVRGRWERVGGDIERTLLDGPDGTIGWRCVAPAARVELGADGALPDGAGGARGGRGARCSGYAEVMELSVLPWKLPIRELRWGRAVSGERSVVWIDWRGPAARTDIFVDGAERRGRVSDEQVEGEGFSLRLERDRTLRDGPIGTTALSEIPGIGGWAPTAFLATRESKWSGRAEFAGPGGPWRGWAIYEVVRFAGTSA